MLPPRSSATTLTSMDIARRKSLRMPSEIWSVWPVPDEHPARISSLWHHVHYSHTDLIRDLSSANPHGRTPNPRGTGEAGLELAQAKVATLSVHLETYGPCKPGEPLFLPTPRQPSGPFPRKPCDQRARGALRLSIKE